MIRPIKRFYRKYSTHNLFILTSLLLFWPLAVYLLWRHQKWSLKARTIVTTVFATFTLLVGIVGYNAPPTIAIADNAITTGYSTDNDYLTIAGDVSTLHSPVLLINGTQVPVDASGNFSYRLALEEGDTDVTIVAKSKKGEDTRSFTVHRTTAAELAERKRQAAERKKAAEERAAKAKAVAEEKAKKARAAAFEAMPICDGTNVKSKCKADGQVYKTYIYHAAVAAKTHEETEVTYKEQITGYCTLCVDGTYSPSCATGRGACSWHGGVAQWNAPIKTKVPVYSTKVVTDVPAKEAYYEKILDPQFE